jgi:DNA ligase-associated metallophosphoesterase
MGETIRVANHSLRLENRYLMLGNTLILADLHLGKTTHFRKAGYAIPSAARGADQGELIRILQLEKPEQVIVLGDLFHSASNSECEELAMITSQFPSVQFELVMGNHDILAPEIYRSMDFETSEAQSIGNLILTHEPLENVPAGKTNMHGHIHPGIRLVGRGRQSLLVPCFHLTPSHFCLPAFGALTGLMRQKPKKADKIYGILEDEVARVF